MEIPPKRVEILDTTLRDGSQQEGLSLTVSDKLRVAEALDHLGVTYIEGGWPGANPKDDEFFSRAKNELSLNTSELIAFGSTRRANGDVKTDPVLENLINAGTKTVCIVAKSWDMHVTEALRTTLDEALLMVKESVEYLIQNGKEVLLDAEHFFDGFKGNRQFALDVLHTAKDAGAKCMVLCDTNGGTLPHEISQIVSEVIKEVGPLGIHCHNDGGVAVANTLAGVVAGVTHVQGCINGYGERTGNADLSAIIPNLALKMGISSIPEDRLELLTPVAHQISELMNVTQNPQQPYVGTAAFAHKAGLHTSAIARRLDAYSHLDPEKVGNGIRFLVSEMSGKATLQIKAKEFGIDIDSDSLSKVVDELKAREYAGYHYEAADGSFELLMRNATGWKQEFFKVESFRVVADWKSDDPSENTGNDGGENLSNVSGKLTTEATVKVIVGGERIVVTREGNGPINALDAALRSAIEPAFCDLKELHLTDYKVRVLDSASGTGAITRVLIDTTDGDKTWSTIGVSQNVIEASWQALIDAIVYGLLRHAIANSETN